ncbi:ABC transporter ATP-binding protein [Orrella sp. 11846]|uniref:ABC transporter ATP-binding protein n=1 Tax=Orrella sp. 11846 TaxID=3409913 RepID=UPI003B59FE26
MLEIKDVNVSYGNVQVLWNLSMHVKDREALAILGANGAGKTSLLRTISGLNVPTSGEIRFQGENIVGVEPYKITQMGIAHVPEGRSLFPNMSVGENLVLGGNLSTPQQRAQTLEWVLSLFPKLEERYKQSAGSLSGGEQQMVALGRALMLKPKLLLLDEPSTGLAPIMLPVIFNAIESIKDEGLTVVVVEQHVQEAFKHVERAYIIENGRITIEGLPKDLENNPEVRRAYLGID